MRAANRFAGMALLAVALTGCSYMHKTQPPLQAQAPSTTGRGSLAQQQANANAPPPAPAPQPATQSPLPALPPPTPKKVKKARRTPRPPKTAETTQAATTTPAPAASPSAEAAGGNASPIGQLTIDDNAAGTETKRQTADLIRATEQGLTEIKRPLSTDEQATAIQAHTFLKQAQQALENDDLDGAYNLATKAKVLLEELTKP